MDAVKEFRKEIKEAFIPLKKEEIQKMHRIQVEMLKDVIHFCEKQNLTYYLTGGSALGVIRHHGNRWSRWNGDVADRCGDIWAVGEYFFLLTAGKCDYAHGKHSGWNSQLEHFIHLVDLRKFL